MASKYSKIGEVAQHLNITVRTIRYYEEQGLVEPDRTNRGTRFCCEHHIDRLKAILDLVDNGFRLEVIALLGSAREACATGDQGSKRSSAILDDAISVIDRQLTDLKALKSELKASQNLVAQCRGCINTPSRKGCPQCKINDNLKKIEMLNLIWA